MKRILITVVLATSVVLSFSAQAFDMPKLPSVGGGSSNAGQDLSGSQDQLMTQYVAASNDVLAANGHMANALNLKDAASTATAVSQSATSGASTDTLKNNDSISGDTTKAIAEAMKNPPPMNAAAKAEFAVGLGTLARGVIKYIGMKDPVSSFSKGLSSASMTMLPKLQTGAYIVKSLPSNIQNLSSSLKNAVAFAKSHDIAIPADATQALGVI